MNIKHLGDKFLRLGKVIYWICILITMLASVIFFTENTDYESTWISYVRPLPYLYLGLSLFLSLLIIEVIRRILKYIYSGQSFFKKELPFGIKYYLYLVALPFLLSLTLTFIGPQIEKKYSYNKAVLETKNFEVFLSNYGSELKKGRECYEKAREERYQSKKTACDANYRRVKMGYDSCMTYGWRTMCLEYDDYEVIDCSKEALLKNEIINSCDYYKIDSDKAVNNYLSHRQYLEMDKRIDILNKIKTVIDNNPDSMLVQKIATEFEVDTFKEELQIINSATK